MTNELESLQRVMAYLKAGGTVHFIQDPEVGPVACGLQSIEWGSDDWFVVNCDKCKAARKNHESQP